VSDYVPNPQPMLACPACGSTRIMSLDGMGGCADCRKAWYAIPAGEAHTVDGELMPFKKACDDCAFRRGSTERADGYAWAQLQDSLEAGGQFFCHKGVPFTLPKDGEQIEFEYPHGADGKPDRSRLRTCAGYLAAIVGPMLRKYELAEQSESRSGSQA
jgi:hypothetical protein